MATNMLIGKKLRGFQFGLETTGGTIVAANKAFKNATFTNKRQNNVKKADAEGHKSAIGQQRGKRWSEWKMTGALGYNIMAYFGAFLFNAASGAAPTNPATGAYKYTYAMLPTTVDTPQTISFEYGNNQGENSKFGFGTMTDLTIHISDSMADYDCAGFGQYPTKPITMTSSPTMISPVLVNMLDCRVNYATTYAGLSGGKLLTAKDIELSVKAKYRSQIFIDDATSSIGGILEKIPDCSCKLIVAEGTESDYFLNNLEASTQSYLQLQATGPILASGSPNTYNSIKYGFSLFTSNEDETDSDELFAGSYDFYTGEDTTNNDINLEVICGLATL
jgi:hypothetical protein